MLYYKILYYRPCQSLNNDIVPKLSTLYELLFDFENFTGTKKDIESIIKTVESQYKTFSKRLVIDKSYIRYETKLFCMLFNCLNVDELIENLKSKL